MGKIDGEKVGIRGGSAGGFTTLACLTDSRVFSVGISLYGVSDIKLLVADTHKVSHFSLIAVTPGRLTDDDNVLFLVVRSELNILAEITIVLSDGQCSLLKIVSIHVQGETRIPVYLDVPHGPQS
jgi:dipeptidyl aminopeptidase/acylaminoacyl peptidase